MCDTMRLHVLLSLRKRGNNKLLEFKIDEETKEKDRK